ncbi:MAG: serine protease inhibitor ecotin [Mixta calida]|jgi:ecotin|uniref:Ecotin n=1 Tax=Mixta calida TaxID=665913 RepID=A0ABN5HBH2_9GAMM|nr:MULTISPECIES: serine protease inhibitor ecotin [Mixta]AIX73164.1 ecotin [Pantoea sp. PSNIH2]MBS6057063.1 serine protease inhibitor ecotin [Pantoea sp.]POU47126.1 ecotin [Pantoea sp. PSNIH5]POU64847.1 ecotin [Pantoea sp. PSNIH4]POY67660.1 ecotin [Pantoea sp. PSNIH3]HCW46717.1 ecotin [Erwiniaceae bacterium]
MKNIAIALSALFIASSAWAGAKSDAGPHAKLESVAPYPAAEKGQIRQVIYLPPQQNEERYKVELLIGKTLERDCNRVMLGAETEQRTLEGWGYDYLVVKRLTPPASTQMMCADKRKHREFIAANLQQGLLRYNSKLPIVVYTPADVEVKYRLWQADPAIADAVKQ